jgi:hypothetical protein
MHVEFIKSRYKKELNLEDKQKTRTESRDE